MAENQRQWLSIWSSLDHSLGPSPRKFTAHSSKWSKYHQKKPHLRGAQIARSNLHKELIVFHFVFLYKELNLSVIRLQVQEWEICRSLFSVLCQGSPDSAWRRNALAPSSWPYKLGCQLRHSLSAGRLWASSVGRCSVTAESGVPGQDLWRRFCIDGWL
jgi:hypothetical protein